MIQKKVCIRQCSIQCFKKKFANLCNKKIRTHLFLKDLW